MVSWILLTNLVAVSLSMPSLPGSAGDPTVPDLPGLPGHDNKPIGDPPATNVIDLNPGDATSCAQQLMALSQEMLNEVEDPNVDCPPAPTKRDLEELEKRDLNIYDAKNACLPLTSESPAGNPYHADLLGVDPNTVLTRDGFGRGFALDGEINTQNTGGATWSLTRTYSFSRSTMLGVTFSDGTTDTRSNGTTWTNSGSQSFQQSLSAVIDKSYSRTNSTDKNGNIATDLQRALAKTHDENTAKTETYSNENSKANAVNWNENTGTTTNNEDGYDVTKTTGSDKTVGFDKSKEHTKSTEITKSKTVSCTIGKTTTGQKGSNNEFRLTVDGGASVSGFIEAGVPLEASGRATISAHVEAGLQGAVTTTGSITAEDSKSITVTYTLTKSSTDSKTSRCSKNGNTVTMGTKVHGNHHNTQAGTSYSKDDGGSFTETKSGSESNSKTKSRSDSISDSLTNGNTTSKGWSRGISDVYGGSTSEGITNVTDIGASFTGSSDFSSSITINRNVEKTNQTTETTTWEIAKGLQINIEKDKCLIPVCMPQVKSTVATFICIPPNTFDKFGDFYKQIVVTEIQSRQSQSGGPRTIFDKSLFDITCNIRWIDCLEKNVPKDEPVFSPGAWYNYIEEQGIHSDANFTSTMATEPNANGYYFGWSADKEFQVKKVGPNGVPSNTDAAVWRSGVMMPLFDNPRLKITDDGHINIYADNVYKYADGNTSKDDLVWSSLPYHVDYAVGTYGNRKSQKNFGYRLTLSQNGIPELYDSLYVKIWSGDDDGIRGNNHCYGYKFPTAVPYPFSYPPNDKSVYCNFKSSTTKKKSQYDLHNAAPDQIKWIGTELAYRTVLNENEGIKSDDGRFTLHLSTTGNLILKEGCRTMWETSTANRWFGQSPFKALVSSNGQLFIKDFKNRAIWSTLVANSASIYKIKISDTGSIIGLDKSDTKVWQNRNDDSVGNQWSVWEVPKVIFDDEAEKPKGPIYSFPLVNLYNARCIKLGDNGAFTTGLVNINMTTGTTDFSDCQLWDYSEEQFTYVTSGSLENCMGPDRVLPCNKYTLWRHYDDGLLVNVETAQCLNGTAALIPCTKDKLRVDKLWSRGFQAVTSIATNATNIFLQGQMYFQRNMGFRYYPDKNKNLIFQVFDYNRPKIKIYQYSLNTYVSANDGTFIRLLSNGLSANVTAFPRTDGQQTQAGVLPFRLDLNDKSLSVLDANNKPLWYWNFRK